MVNTISTALVHSDCYRHDDKYVTCIDPKDLKCILLNWNYKILLEILLKSIPKGPIQK